MTSADQVSLRSFAPMAIFKKGVASNIRFAEKTVSLGHGFLEDNNLIQSLMKLTMVFSSLDQVENWANKSSCNGANVDCLLCVQSASSQSRTLPERPQGLPVKLPTQQSTRRYSLTSPPDTAPDHNYSFSPGSDHMCP